MGKINISVTLPVKAIDLYNAWLDSKKHSAFTGGKAKISGKIGASFSAWDEYITGKTLELVEGEFIKQSWRTVEFPEGAEDSILELKFEEKDGKTKLHLTHYNLQRGDAEKYEEGWKDHYFKPMKTYFSLK